MYLNTELLRKPGVHARRTAGLASLRRDQHVAADMIEMRMRVDDGVDLAGISLDRFEPALASSPPAHRQLFPYWRDSHPADHGNGHSGQRSEQPRPG